MVEYIILSAPSSSDLAKKVNDFIRVGWKPQGGVCLTGDAYGFYQSMVKEQND